MSKSSSGVLKEVDTQLKGVRKSLRSTSKSVLKDLDDLQQKLPGRGGAKKSTSTRSSTARKSTARKSTARSTASKSTSSRSSSSRSKSTTSPRARTTAPRARAKKS
ncbi:MAG TPA: hypothetical protein VF032_12740 [Thermoleophilaceae bacterium]